MFQNPQEDKDTENSPDVTKSINKLRIDLQKVVEDLKEIENHAGQVRGLDIFKDYLNKTIHSGVNAYNDILSDGGGETQSNSAPSKAAAPRSGSTKTAPSAR